MRRRWLASFPEGLVFCGAIKMLKANIFSKQTSHKNKRKQLNNKSLFP
jgi:hypothetical protein